jgi:NADH-quinone oxidoreductase subunit G
VRGYRLETLEVAVNGDETLKPFSAEAAITGSAVYLANPVLQFSAFTAKAHQLAGKGGLYASKGYLEANGLNEGDRVKVKTASGELTVNVIADGKIEGDTPYLPTFDTEINSEALFNGYRFAGVSIQKV